MAHKCFHSIFSLPRKTGLRNLGMASIALTLGVFVTTTAAATGNDEEHSCKIEGEVEDSVAMMNNGMPIHRVALGVYQTVPGTETYEAVKAALKAGYRHIDTG